MKKLLTYQSLTTRLCVRVCLITSLFIIAMTLWTLYCVGGMSISRGTLPVIVTLALTIVVLYVVLSWVIRGMTRPLRLFSDYALEISKGNFDTELPSVDNSDEMSQLRDSFAKMQESLSHYMRELEESTRSQAFLMSELQIASRIQDDLLPKVFPPFPGRDDINIRAALLPARQIGGDLYNFFMREGKVFFIIADVSGKSVPAAIVMAIACNVFNTVAAHSDDSAKIMEELNAVTCANNANSGFFITALVGILDLDSGRLDLCNAGHDPALIVAPDGDVTLLKITPNLPAGVMPGMKYQSQTMQLGRGLRLFLYTDGITDAEDAGHQFYGIERLKACVHTHAHSDLGELISFVVEDVHNFSGFEQTDDLTMMVLDYMPSDVAMPAAAVLGADIEQLTKVRDFADQVVARLGLQPCAGLRLNLVLEEVCSNILKYAFTGWVDNAMTIYASVRGPRLYVIVGDAGQAFDPTAVSDADVTLPLEERPIGGLGITLVRKYTEEMNYNRVNNHNYLTLVFDMQRLNNENMI